MTNTTRIPDRVSTLELSKLYIYKALQNLNAQESQPPRLEDDR